MVEKGLKAPKSRQVKLDPPPTLVACIVFLLHICPWSVCASVGYCVWSDLALKNVHSETYGPVACVTGSIHL